MIDQQTTIALAVQSGVIDSADIDSIHIPQGYIDDLAHFAYLVEQHERNEIVSSLAKLENVMSDAKGPEVIRFCIGVILGRRITE